MATYESYTMHIYFEAGLPINKQTGMAGRKTVQHVSCNLGSFHALTEAGIQSVCHAAKMEWARQVRAQKKRK